MNNDPALTLSDGNPVIPPVLSDIGNPDWAKAAARVLIVRLSPWRDMESSGSHLVLFDEVRRQMPDAYIDFAFLPVLTDRKKLSSLGKSWFFGRASGRMPNDFDLVMISNSCALELVNIAYIFTSSGMPILARQRMLADAMPLCIIGGSNSSALGAVLSDSDSIVDGIFFGEGEASIGILADILCSKTCEKPDLEPPRPARLSSYERKANLAKASEEITGFWACAMPRNAKRLRAEGRPHTVVNPLLLNGERASTVRLTITAGCMGFCSFCLEGWDRSPYIEADFSSIIEKARELRRRSGAAELDVSSYNFNTHSRIFDLIFELNKIFRRVSFMSQRLDILAETKNLMETELASGKRSFTLGIEGISKAMRAYYRKGLSPENLRTCLEKTLRKEVRELKLFFIISGLETKHDTDEFEGFLQTIQRIRKERSLSTRIIVSAGYLVRLPFTPLQYAPVAFDRELLENIARTMDDSCRSMGLEFRLAGTVDECFVDQTLSLFGDLAHDWLLSLPRRGILYDASLPASAWKSLEKILMAHPRIDWILGEKSYDFQPPLGFIETEARYSALWHNYLEARALRDRQSCFGYTCSACEACTSKEEIKLMTGHEIKKLSSAMDIEKIHSLVLAKTRFEAVYSIIDVPENLAMADSSYRGSWVSREFSRFQGNAQSWLFEAKEIPWIPVSDYGRYGLSCFELYGPSPDLLKKMVRTLMASSDKKILREIRLIDSKPQPSIVHASILIPGAGEETVPIVRKLTETYLHDGHIDFTAKRLENGWKFDISPSSRGRKNILSANIAANRVAATLNLGLGANAEPSRLIKELGKYNGSPICLKIQSWEP